MFGPEPSFLVFRGWAEKKELITKWTEKEKTFRKNKKRRVLSLESQEQETSKVVEETIRLYKGH